LKTKGDGDAQSKGDAMDLNDAGPLESASMPLHTALTVAVSLHRRGNLANAETIYRGILEATPDHPDALHFLGVLSHQLGKSSEAAELIRKAIAVFPHNPDMHNNLGNVLKEQGRFSEAEAAYESVIAINPQNADAYNNLGVIKKNQGKYAEAEKLYRRAIELRPDHADAYLNLGNVLNRQDKTDQAAEACRKAIELKPNNSKAYQNLAMTFHKAGKIDEAEIVLKEWLNFCPENPIAIHLLASLTGKSTPTRASDEYVKELFDDFASSFDECLNLLGYKAPALTAEALEKEIGGCGKQIDILDAGCGTGLCGPLLAPMARRLTGVDLSPAMIARAKERNVYDELEVCELTEFLAAKPNVYDAVVSADTLVYFGALNKVFSAAAASLRPRGVFIFSVEEEINIVQGFCLNPHGRYGHTEAYIKKTLYECDFSLINITRDILRKEVGQPVEGLIATARKGRN